MEGKLEQGLAIMETAGVLDSSADERMLDDMPLFNTVFAEWVKSQRIPAQVLDLETSDRLFKLAFWYLNRSRAFSSQLAWFVGDLYNALREYYDEEAIANGLSPDYGRDGLETVYDIKTLEKYARVAAAFGPETRNFDQPFSSYIELYESSQRLAREHLGLPSTKLDGQSFAAVRELAAKLREDPLAELMQSTEPIQRQLIRARVRDAMLKLRTENEPTVIITHEGKELVIGSLASEETARLLGSLTGRFRFSEFFARVAQLLSLSGKEFYPCELRLVQPGIGEHRVRFKVKLPVDGIARHVRLEEIKYEFVYEASYVDE